MFAVLHLTNIITAILMLSFLHDRLRHISDKRQEHVVWAFVIGGVLSSFLVQMLYQLYPLGMQRALSGSALLYHILVVGLVEETGKFLSFLVLVHLVGKVREPQDGVIYGAVIGATFGVLENMLYFSWYESWWLILRPFVTSPGHAIYGAIWGAFYSQAIFANREGTDRGAWRNSIIGIVLVSVLHGMYNASTWSLWLGFLLDGVALLIAWVLFRRLVELSPYRVFPLSEARRAIPALRRGLLFNPKSPYLNRNLGLYLMRAGEFSRAVEHLRASVPRTRDPRRVRFLAAACDTVLLPEYHARRGLRVAWARLTDEQRLRFSEQLEALVGRDHAIVARVKNLIDGAFTPRDTRSPREIARDAKIRRVERRNPRNSASLEQAVARLAPDERAALAEKLRRSVSD